MDGNHDRNRALREISNCQPVAISDIPQVIPSEWRDRVVHAVKGGWRLCTVFGMPGLARPLVRLYAVLAREREGQEGVLSVLATEVGNSYPALTPECPQAHWHEREIAERLGIQPEGHPWLKPIRNGKTEFFRVEGEEIHEVAVGPVHAGVIEPGHFRFQCHGERVFHLEIALGYQHRGIERALVGGPDRRTLHFMETLAGDTTVGHSLAYCQLIEALAGCAIPEKAMVLRGVALELERLANHTGDLGALAGDVGYLPTASFCGRLRGDYLNLTAQLCGNRFGRGLVRPGGVGFDAQPELAHEMLKKLNAAYEDTASAADLLWATPSVLSRFEGTGALTSVLANDLGLSGPCARACGITRDVRKDFPQGIFRRNAINVSTGQYGDVYSRARVRWQEIRESVRFLREQLANLPEGGTQAPCGNLAPDTMVVSLVEGWRGEICHVALTDQKGRFSSYRVFDPSFRNWFGLAQALRGQEISDFPLCNKSFNLSYCGHDL